MEDGTSFLLNTSPDWWLGEWGRGAWATTGPHEGQASGPQPVWVRGWAVSGINVSGLPLLCVTRVPLSVSEPMFSLLVVVRVIGVGNTR